MKLNVGMTLLWRLKTRRTEVAEVPLVAERGPKL